LAQRVEPCLGLGDQFAAATTEGTGHSVPVLDNIPHLGRLFIADGPVRAAAVGAPVLKDIPIAGRLYVMDQPREPARHRKAIPVLAKIPFIDRLFR
jgi:type II secretory pathway component GspD/PulD (secretin)